MLRNPALRACSHGLLVLLILLVAVVAIEAAWAGWQYNGRCGGLLPFIGQSRDCSRMDYIAERLRFAVPVLLHSGWYFGVLAAVLAAGISYALTTRSSSQSL